MKTIIVKQGTVLDLGGGKFSSSTGGEYAVEDKIAEKYAAVGLAEVTGGDAEDVGPGGCSVVPRDGAAGWFDVVDATGQTLNENAMRRDAADALAAEHNFEG